MATKEVNLRATGLATGGIEIRGALNAHVSEVLTPEALAFLARLARKFEAGRQALLESRIGRQEEIFSGKLPGFLPETSEIRAAEWTVAPIPRDLADRRVEITGPVDRKMIINALNSGANVFMADFEDSNSPTWQNNIEGQFNLRDAVNRSIQYQSPEGKQYALAEKTAVLMVRPRGLHLIEKHVWIDGKPVSASLFDFSLFFFHNARSLMGRGTGPYFYIPKLESHLEARWWNEVFNAAQDGLGIARGTIRATVLIETILAAFEMDEILYELRDHSAGLNCGRWDYIFSFIKKFRDRPDFVLPDRGSVTMDRHFLNSYVLLLIQTCHRRGIHAMGGMAAQIPIRTDPAANERALEKVKQDKLREVKAGHDGTWVAHPGLVPVAKDIFDAGMREANQIARKREDVSIQPSDLLQPLAGPITEAGLKTNIDVGLQYLESWLMGSGCVPIYNLMEDAATAEISRAQVWQWVRHGAKTAEGGRITPEAVRNAMLQELRKQEETLGPARFAASKFELAARLFGDMMTSAEFTEFMPLLAYNFID
ncbi:MAG: malate synthase A [Terriglobia bacterium]